MELIPIEKERLEQAGIFYKKATLYYWHSTGKHPELFLSPNGKGGKLFIVKEKWLEIMEKAKQETATRAEKINRLKGELINAG